MTNVLLFPSLKEQSTPQGCGGERSKRKTGNILDDSRRGGTTPAPLRGVKLGIPWPHE